MSRTSSTTRTLPPEKTSPATRAVLYSLMATLFLSALDQTVVATALPTIAGDLGGLNSLTWVVTAYTLSCGIAMPLYGKIGDMYGRKPAFVFATAVFVLGSALCAAVPSMGMMIAARVLQGIGGGGLMVLAMAIVADVTTPRQRGRYMGMFGALFGVASIAGPFVGGFFTDHLSWRWAFLINVPLGAIALAISITVMHLPRRRSPHRIDIGGALLLSAAISCLTLFATWGGQTYAWSSPVIISLIVGFLVLLAAFLLVESRVAEPIIPLSLFRNRIFILAAIAIVLVGTTQMTTATYLPSLMQFTFEASATSSGLLLFPMMAGMITSSTLGGRLITRIGRYKWAPVVGTAITAAAVFLLSTVSVGMSIAVPTTYMVLLGIGMGLAMQPLMMVVQLNSSPQDLGAATSTATFAQRVGASIGLASLGAVFTSRLANGLATQVPGSVDLPDPASLTPSVVHGLPTQIQAAIQQIFTDGLTDLFLATVPLMIVGFIITLFLPNTQLED